MKASVQLRLARAIATHPDTRGTGWYAKDANGLRVDPDNDNACRWCALGALSKVTGIKVFDSSSDLMESPAGRLLNEAAKRVSNNYTVAGVHDDMDSDVNEHMWSVAIELAEAEEAQEAELESSGKAVRACNLQPGQRVIIPDNDTDPTEGVAITVGRAAAVLDMMHVYPIEDVPMVPVRYFSVRKDRLLYLAEPESKRIDHLPANQVRPRMYVMFEGSVRLVKEVQFSNLHWVRLVFVPMPGDLARYWDVQVHELVDVVGETEPKPVYVKVADLQPGSLFVYPHNDGDTINLKGLICELDEESDALGLYGFRRLALRVHGEPVRHYRNLRETDIVELISAPKIEYVQGVPLTYDDFHKTGQAQRLLDPLAHVHTGEAIVPKPAPRKILAKDVKPGMRIRGSGWQVNEITVLRVTEASLKGLLRLFYTDEPEKWMGGECWCIEGEDEVELLEEAPESRKILAGDVKPGMRVRWFYDTGTHGEMLVVKVEPSDTSDEWVRLYESDRPYDYRVFDRDREMELISESNSEPEDQAQPDEYTENDKKLDIARRFYELDGSWPAFPPDSGLGLPWYGRPTASPDAPYPDNDTADRLGIDVTWTYRTDGQPRGLPGQTSLVTSENAGGQEPRVLEVKFRGAENTDDTPPFELFAGTSKALDELGKQLRARAMAEAAAADGSIVHDSTGQVVKPVPVTGNEIAGCSCCICEYYRNSQLDEHPTGGPDIETDMLAAKLEALMLGLFEGALEPDEDDVIDVHVIVIAG